MGLGKGKRLGGLCHESGTDVGREANGREGDELLWEVDEGDGSGKRRSDGTDLEGLGIPVLDLVDRRHISEVVW